MDLDAGQPLTLDLTLPAGVVDAFTEEDLRDYYLRSNLELVFLAAFVSLSVITAFLLWLVVGKDFPAKTAVPSYELPEFSPGEVSVIDRMSEKSVTISSSIIGFGGKRVSSY